MIRTVTEEEHKEDVKELLNWYRKRIMPYANDTYLQNILHSIKTYIEIEELKEGK